MQLELRRRTLKIANVVGNQGIRPSIDRSFQNQFIRRIGKLRTPSEVHLYRLCSAREGGQCALDIVLAHSRSQSMLRAEQDVLVFKEQSGRYQRPESALRDLLQNQVACAPTASKGRNQDRGIQNYTFHILYDSTSHKMSMVTYP